MNMLQDVLWLNAFRQNLHLNQLLQEEKKDMMVGENFYSVLSIIFFTVCYFKSACVLNQNTMEMFVFSLLSNLSVVWNPH